MDILDMLSGKLNDQKAIDELSRSTGADNNKVKQAVDLGIPTLVEAMNRNARTQQGASSLAEALDEHKDNRVDDVGDFLRRANTQDGSKILDHVFGSNNRNVQNNLSRQTGLQQNQVSSLMAQLAPLVMSMLGKQKASNNVGANDLPTMLMSLLGSNSNSGLMGTVTGMLDKDGDGSIMDDLGDIVGDIFKK
nr:DUF937 domain-containing protein [Tissierella sp.]